MHGALNLAAGPSASRSDVRLLIVDDQRVFRGALRDLITTAPGFVVIGEACSGEDAVQAVERLAPELVLMDVAMPGMGGVAAMWAILSRHPELTVVLISANEHALDRAESVLPPPWPLCASRTFGRGSSGSCGSSINIDSRASPSRGSSSDMSTISCWTWLVETAI